MNYFKKTIEYIFYIFIFLLPWQTRLIFPRLLNGGYWEYGSFSVYATDLIFIFLLILSLLFLFFCYKKDPWRFESIMERFRRTKSINFLALLFLASVYFSIFISFNSLLSLYAATKILQGVFLFWIILIIGFDFKKTAWVFVFSAFIQSILAIFQFGSQTAFANKWLGMASHNPSEGGTFVVETVLRRWLRSYGSFGHPNILAGFLSASFVILTGLYLKTKQNYKKIILVVCSVFICFGLLSTFSRSAFLALILAFIILWLKNFFKKSSWQIKSALIKFTLIILLATIVFGLVYSKPFLVRAVGQERLEIKSNSQRMAYNEQALSFIKSSFWGVGAGNYTLAVHHLINPFWTSWNYQPVHNIYLLIWSELGVIGILFFILMLFKIFWSAKDKKEIDSWQNIYFTVFIILLFIGLFDHYLWTLHFGIMFFWLNLGLLLKSKLL